MKNKSNKIVVILSIFVVFSMILIGYKCNFNKKILYTNMNDSKSRKEVTEILKEHGVSNSQISKLNTWIKDFNSHVKDNSLSDGFKVMNNNLVDYSNLQLENTPSYIVNCRLTSFLLTKNMITTNAKPDNTDTYLFFDLEEINNHSQLSMTEKDKLNYATLFNWIPLDNAKTLSEHIEKIESKIKERNIYIDNSKGFSLINVYLHSSFDNIRFVGHTGVLVDNGKDLLFIEKYGPYAPFQATKFNNRNELKKYLLSRSDLYGEKTELEPIIIENYKVMKTN